MGWLKRPEVPHICRQPPNRNDITRGSVWRCDDCGRIWLYRGDPIYGFDGWVRSWITCWKYRTQ